MKSRANLKSHPIHPMLVTLPIGLWTASLAYDLAAAARGSRRLQDSADDMMLAGLIGALAAAVPGAIDYFAVIPPESSAKQRGATHGLLNLSLAGLYGANWLLRSRSGRRWRSWLGIPLSLAGFSGLMYSGWLGGTLVYRNQIGVDHRGPNAAKWRESGPIEGPPGEAVDVASMDELEKPGQTKLVHLNGHRIVVARDGDRIVAFQDHCTHRGGPLADGVLACGVITCPWHGSQFNVETGEVVGGPAEEKIQIYPIRVDGDAIQIVAPEPLTDATIAGKSGLLPAEETRQRIGQAVQQTVERVRSLVPAGRDGGSSSGRMKFDED
jgi:nitrite reductase/ring-hydroxylating ferredoxin subunit/uncharacterized membrane protein